MSARCRVMCGCADQRHRGVLRMHPRQSCVKAIQGSVGISRCTRQGGLHEDTGKHVRCTRSHARDVGIWVQQRWPIAIPDSTSARGAAAAADSVARDSLLAVRSSFRANRDRKSAGGKRRSVLRAVRTTRRAQFPTHGCSGRVQFRRPSGRRRDWHPRDAASQTRIRLTRPGGPVGRKRPRLDGRGQGDDHRRHAPRRTSCAKVGTLHASFAVADPCCNWCRLIPHLFFALVGVTLFFGFVPLIFLRVEPAFR